MSFLTDWPRWAVMWSIALMIYACLKTATWWNSGVQSDVRRQSAYLLAWPGMDAEAFLAKPAREVPAAQEWIFALLKTIFGAILLQWAAMEISHTYTRTFAWVGLVGLTFLLHFGVFHVLSCIWRAVGWRADPIMNWPIASESLAEFWGRRWNLAFRDLTHRFLFQPLRRSWGATGALVMGFFVSGLIHDLVISVPAGGGWGLPTLYFMIQGVGVLAERSQWARAIGISRGLGGRLYVACVLIFPLPLLFHEAFVVRVWTPFLCALGSLR